MLANRRRVLAALGMAAASGTIAWWKRATLGPWLLAGALADEAPGPLPDSTAETLRAVVVALLDPRVQTAHYIEFFAWRARHVPGSRALDVRFERWLDAAARRAGATAFRHAPPELQKSVLRPLSSGGQGTRLRRVALARDEQRFARHVVRETFRIFARTDAWRLAGYAAWPGMPRGVLHLHPPTPPTETRS